MNAKEIQKKLKQLANPKKAKDLQKYFKTAKGEYGEGDIFLGIPVPDLRKEAKLYKTLPLLEIQKLLNSSLHEERQLALFILVLQYTKAEESKKKEIYHFYLKHTEHINNWDLVDSSAHYIVGAYLFDKKRDILYKLARSKSLWERRIAMMSCFYFIKQNDYSDALAIAELLLEDKEDLIHKAVGWMLREIGKNDKAEEEAFLKKWYSKMPRTMLRYAIEKFPEKERKAYLQKIIPD
ncbi:MAG: DNA alkylation repair protein [Leptospiraceae bacterium]|nr:DNA alkylation repair protein [Leptospiraceae bacterium]